jgi:quercetin dioxygenase-like cupin family protein
MPILRGVLGKVPSGPKSRVRNFIANKEFGTQSDIHENVISPGVTVPWHFHETEEVIVVLEGRGECRTEEGTENYSAGDILILPPRVKHSLRNSGATLIRVRFGPLARVKVIDRIARSIIKPTDTTIVC